ncbi:hypothetical protein AmDm5_2128 [Acetobacter malorum]|nr:hypothetical protein AmDm5_2128 [Acetobacter malorum]
MPRKERLVNRDILDTGCFFPEPDIHHPVDEQERISVRNRLHNARDVNRIDCLNVLLRFLFRLHVP